MSCGHRALYIVATGRTDPTRGSHSRALWIRIAWPRQKKGTSTLRGCCDWQWCFYKRSFVPAASRQARASGRYSCAGGFALCPSGRSAGVSFVYRPLLKRRVLQEAGT